MFNTTRMSVLRGVNPIYLPGQFIFLQREVQGFAKGTQGKVVSVQSTRPGEHRYQLLIGDQKLWAFEADLRPTAPGEAPLTEAPDGTLSITQKLQSMTLNQRMATLGVDETRRLDSLGATQRMHVLTPDERLQQLLATNRSQTLRQGTTGGSHDTTGPDAGAPVADPVFKPPK